MSIRVVRERLIHKRSKRQKRQRTKAARERVQEFFTPYFRDSIDKETITMVMPSRVRKRLPSLVELTLGACRTQIPAELYASPSVQNAIQQSQLDEEIGRLRIKWLQGKLEILEDNYTKHKFQYGLECRSIFDEDHKNWKHDSTCKRFLRLRNIALMTSHQDFWSFPLAVLSHLVDLSLPDAIADESLHGAGHERHNRNPSIALNQFPIIQKLRKHLTNRCPVLVGKFFDISMAYVWWARGRLTNAVETFHRVCNQWKLDPSSEENMYSSLLEKSSFLNEIGRLHSVNGEAGKAGYCYRQAVDICCSEGCKLQLQDDLILQCHCLTAAGYSQGLKTKASASCALNSWDIVLATPDAVPMATVAAIEAHLRCFAGFSKDEIMDKSDQSDGWFQDNYKTLQSHVNRIPELFLHLSLVCAMLGKKSKSERTFKEFHDRHFISNQHYHKKHGSFLCPWQQQDYNPWASLIDVAMETGQPIAAMKLLWQRSLLLPAYHNESRYSVGESSSEPLNLYMTEDGYLTGDVYLSFPPIRALLLDPYDGSLCFPSSSKKQFSFHWLLKSPSPPELPSGRIDHLPTPVRVYEDSAARVFVDLIKLDTKEAGATELHNQVAYLWWRGPNKVRKLDIRKKVRLALKKVTMEHIDKLNLVHRYKLWKVEKMKDSLKERVEKHFNSGWLYHSCHINESYQCNCGKKTTRAPPFVLYVCGFTRFGRGTVVLFLHLRHGYEPGNNPDMLCFINCSSPDTFLNPKIHCLPSANTQWDISSCFPSMHCRQSPNRECSYFVIRTAMQSIWPRTSTAITQTIFDEDGEIIRAMEKDTDPSLFDHHFVGGFQHYLYRVDSAKTRLLVENVQDQYSCAWHLCKLVPNATIDSVTVVCNTLLIKTSSNHVLAIDAKTLQHLPVTADDDAESKTAPSSGGIFATEDEIRQCEVMAYKDCMTLLSHCRTTVRRFLLNIETSHSNHLILLERSANDERDKLSVLCEVKVPGRPTEANYVSQDAGFVVVATLNHPDDKPYRDHLYWYSTRGELRGVLPFLGKGPHSLYSVYLSGDENQAETEGWYLYFTDGHGAICAAKLS
ncbi:uncharacterized protein [Ptychodera flava]